MRRAEGLKAKRLPRLQLREPGPKLGLTRGEANMICDSLECLIALEPNGGYVTVRVEDERYVFQVTKIRRLMNRIERFLKETR